MKPQDSSERSYNGGKQGQIPAGPSSDGRRSEKVGRRGIEFGSGPKNKNKLLFSRIKFVTFQHTQSDGAQG